MEAVEQRRLFSIIYVDVHTSGPTHDGSSWGSAFTDLQQGLAVSGAGDEIHVADGIYSPISAGGPSPTFQLKNGVAILGGYAGFEAVNPDQRDIPNFQTQLSNATNVVTGSGVDSTAVLDGVILSGGGGAQGGGMRIVAGSPTITNCTFSGCSNSALFMSGSAPTLTNCTFINNSGAADGEAMWCAASSAPVLNGCSIIGDLGQRQFYFDASGGTLTRCAFSGLNTDLAVFCGNSSSPTFTECSFISGSLGTNAVQNFGGSSTTFTNCTFTGQKNAAMINDHSSPHLSGCLFNNNLSGHDGGAIYNITSSPIITDCIFSGNGGGTLGGAIYNSASSPVLNNCTFTGNKTSTSGSGGAIYNAASSAPTLTNCNFSGNQAGSGGAIYNDHSSFTLTGCAIIGNQAVNGGRGGGMFNTASSPTLNGCTFSGNYADGASVLGSGGGMYNTSASAPVMNNCDLSGNYSNPGSVTGGGALYNASGCNASVNNCRFFANSASIGAAVTNDSCSATFTGCSFDANLGIAVLNTISGSPALVGCTFTRNLNGAAVDRGSPTPLFKSCSFRANSATALSHQGGTATVVNCTFVGNSGSTGGAISNSGSTSSLFLINCSLINNSAINGGGLANSSSSATVSNCIFWGNTATNGSQIRFSTGPISVTYSDIQDGFTGTSNVNADPQFAHSPSSGTDGKWGTVDDDYGDLRLWIASPCIDVGSNAAVPVGVTTDAAGSPRIVDVPGKNDPGAIVDMGAYERTASFADGNFLVDASRPSVRITFNTDASAGSISAGDLLLVNLTSSAVIDSGTASTVSYDAATRTATWAFSINLSDGNYRATLPAGNVLDPTESPILTTDLTFDFFVLAGDANRDRTVDINDLAILAMNWQGSGKVFSQGDFNYDGKVDAKDLGILSANWQKNLPAPAAPGQPVGVTPTAPRRTATRVAALVL
jgi:parallel beta-helix repeat protein/predicted outer membrane repeat protein